MPCVQSKTGFAPSTLVFYIASAERAVARTEQTIERNQHRLKQVSNAKRHEAENLKRVVVRLRSQGRRTEATLAEARHSARLQVWDVRARCYRARVKTERERLKAKRIQLMAWRADLARKTGLSGAAQ